MNLLMVHGTLLSDEVLQESASFVITTHKIKYAKSIQVLAPVLGEVMASPDETLMKTKGGGEKRKIGEKGKEVGPLGRKRVGLEWGRGPATEHKLLGPKGSQNGARGEGNTCRARLHSYYSTPTFDHHGAASPGAVQGISTFRRSGARPEGSLL